MTRTAPHWPRKMKADLASKYVDEGESTFRQRVEDGIYPKGTQIGGNVYWFLEDLDAALDRLHGTEAADPFMEAINAR